MTIDIAKAILAQVTYKQGWKIEIRKGLNSECPYIYVEMPKQLDASQPETGILHPVWMHYYVPIEYMMGPGDLLDQVKSAVLALEFHESQEWLKVDGKHIDPPKH
jgi:hypothetical protein